MLQDNEIAAMTAAKSNKKGRRMFLIRAAFWLTVVVFLLPGDPGNSPSPGVGGLVALERCPGHRERPFRLLSAQPGRLRDGLRGGRDLL